MIQAPRHDVGLKRLDGGKKGQRKMIFKARNEPKQSSKQVGFRLVEELKKKNGKALKKRKLGMASSFK